MKRIRVKNKFLRRLLGEEKGLVMFEYILLGLLIGTAVVGGAWMIAKAINGGFNTMGTAATTKGQDAIQAAANEARDTQTKDAQKAKEHLTEVTQDE